MKFFISSVLLMAFLGSCSSNLEPLVSSDAGSDANFEFDPIQYEAAKNEGIFDPKDDSLIGTWEGDWYKGDRIELVLNHGVYFRRNYYTIDTIVSHELEIRDTNGIRSFVNKDEPSLEYYRIEGNGNLGRYSKWLKVEEIEKIEK